MNQKWDTSKFSFHKMTFDIQNEIEGSAVWDNGKIKFNLVRVEVEFCRINQFRIYFPECRNQNFC